MPVLSCPVHRFSPVDVRQCQRTLRNFQAFEKHLSEFDCAALLHHTVTPRDMVASIGNVSLFPPTDPGGAPQVIAETAMTAMAAQIGRPQWNLCVLSGQLILAHVLPKDNQYGMCFS